LFDVDLMGALFSLIAGNGIVILEKYDQYVYEHVRISLYGDFLYPLAENSTLAQFYKEKPEGTFCDEL
jgi:fucokinase